MVQAGSHASPQEPKPVSDVVAAVNAYFAAAEAQNEVDLRRGRCSDDATVGAERIAAVRAADTVTIATSASEVPDGVVLEHLRLAAGDRAFVVTLVAGGQAVDFGYVTRVDTERRVLLCAAFVPGGSETVKNLLANGLPDDVGSLAGDDAERLVPAGFAIERRDIAPRSSDVDVGILARHVIVSRRSADGVQVGFSIQRFSSTEARRDFFEKFLTANQWSVVALSPSDHAVRGIVLADIDTLTQSPFSRRAARVLYMQLGDWLFTGSVIGADRAESDRLLDELQERMRSNSRAGG